MLDCVSALVVKLKESAKPVMNNEELRAIATVSASGNEHMGRLIAEAFDKV